MDDYEQPEEEERAAGYGNPNAVFETQHEQPPPHHQPSDEGTVVSGFFPRGVDDSAEQQERHFTAALAAETEEIQYALWRLQEERLQLLQHLEDAQEEAGRRDALVMMMRADLLTERTEKAARMKEMRAKDAELTQLRAELQREREQRGEKARIQDSLVWAYAELSKALTEKRLVREELEKETALLKAELHSRTAQLERERTEADCSRARELKQQTVLGVLQNELEKRQAQVGGEETLQGQKKVKEEESDELDEDGVSIVPLTRDGN